MTSARAPTTAATWWTITFWPRFIDLEIAATESGAIESGDSLRGLGVIGHLDESKATSATGFSVGDDVNSSDLPEWLKQRSQIGLRSLKTHISDKKILHTIS